MGIKRASTFHRNSGAFSLAFLFALGLVLMSAMAIAQDQPAPTQKPPQSEGFFATINRWFERQTANMSASFNDARKKVEGWFIAKLLKK